MVRRLLTLLALLIAPVAISACGGTEDSASDGTTTVEPAAATTSSDGGAKGRGAKNEPQDGPRGDAGSSSSGGSSSASSGPAAADGQSSQAGGASDGSGRDRSIQEFGEPAAAGEQQEVAGVLDAFFVALAEGDAQRACDALAAPVAEQLATLTGEQSADCVEALSKLLDGYPGDFKRKLRTASVSEVRVEGDRAFALYSQRGTPASFIPMVRDGERWKVGALGGAALP